MKSSELVISIIIPIYNVESYVIRCLKSVVNQSFKDFEVLLIDDKGKDNSMNLVRKFIQENPEIEWRIIEHVENRGLSCARNTGMDHAKGEYIYFLDSDDAIHPQTLEKLFNLAESTNAQMTLGQSICINEKEGWERNYFPVKIQTNTLEGNPNILWNFVNGQYPVMACDKMVRLDFIMENKLYFVPKLYSQDELWSFHLALKLEKVAFLKGLNTYNYYFHSGSIIHNRGPVHFNNWITITEYFHKAYLENSKDKKRRTLILKKIINFKSGTLTSNWQAQRNPKLWLRSFKAYQKTAKLKFADYFSDNFSTHKKLDSLQLSLPAKVGFYIFLVRFYRKLNVFKYMKIKS